MAGLTSYDNSTKEQWRNWQWNRAVERFPEMRCRPGFNVKRMNNYDRMVCSKKIVVYLCGPDDFDRQCGLDRGFLNENMIAIDVVSENVAKVRKNGGLAVCCGLSEFLENVDGIKIDLVIADFCGGLSSKAVRFIKACIGSHSIHEGTVISANLLRGRDAYSNKFRHAVKSISGIGSIERIHRGIQFYLQCASLSGVSAWHSGHPQFEKPSMFSAWLRSKTIKSLEVNEYSSVGNMKFDSAVFKWFPELVSKRLHRASFGTEDSEKIRQKIAALKAIRTMKIRNN